MVKKSTNQINKAKTGQIWLVDIENELKEVVVLFKDNEKYSVIFLKNDILENNTIIGKDRFIKFLNKKYSLSEICRYHKTNFLDKEILCF